MPGTYIAHALAAEVPDLVQRGIIGDKFNHYHITAGPQYTVRGLGSMAYESADWLHGPSQVYRKR